MQSMTVIADKAIPRAAENIALAIGALCVVRSFFMAVHPILHLYRFRLVIFSAMLWHVNIYKPLLGY